MAQKGSTCCGFGEAVPAILTLSAKEHKMFYFYMECWLKGFCCNYFVISAAFKLNFFSKDEPNNLHAGGRKKAKDKSTGFGERVIVEGAGE